MNDEFEKIERFFNHILDQTIDSVYINENDDFVMEFSDGSLMEIFSDDGDLGIYFEIGEADGPTLQ